MSFGFLKIALKTMVDLCPTCNQASQSQYGQLWRQRWNGSMFLPWESLGSGYFATGPATAPFADGKEGIFIIGKSGQLYTFTSDLIQTGKFSTAWTLNTTNGTWAGIEPTPLRWGFNMLYVFLVSADASLYYQAFADSNPGMLVSIGGYCTSRPVSVSWGTDSQSISVFVRGGDGALWWTSLAVSTGQWSAWESLAEGVQIAGEPEVVSVSPKSIQIFVFAWASNDGSVLYKSFDGFTWTPSSGFSNLGIKLSGPPKASTKHEGELILFGYAADGRVLSKIYNETEGGWANGTMDLGAI